MYYSRLILAFGASSKSYALARYFVIKSKRINTQFVEKCRLGRGKTTHNACAYPR